MTIVKYIRWVTTSRNAKYLMILVLGFIVVSALGLKELTLASDYKIFFDKNDENLLRLEGLQETYTKTDNIFIMIQTPNSVYNKDSLALIHEMTQSLWQVPYSSRVDSVSNYPYSYADGDDIIIEEFILEVENINPEKIRFMKDEIPEEKDLVDKLVTSDGIYAAINVTILLPGEDVKKETMEVNAQVAEILARLRNSYPDHKVYVTGILPMNGAFFKAAKHDFITLIPLMMLFVLIIAGLVLNSVSAAFIILGVVLLSFLGALGMAGWIGIQLSAPSISAPIIMFTVIVASSIHIITYIKRLGNKKTARESVVASYRRNATPVVMSHITTVIGFLAMNASDSPPFRDLGNIVVLGVIFSLILVLTILPYILSKVVLASKNFLVLLVSSFSKALAEWVISYRSIILVLIPSVTIGLFLLGLNNELDDNLVKYFDRSVEFRQHAEAVDEHFSGIYNIDYSLSTGRENGTFNIEFLKFVESFELWLGQQDQVVSVDSPLHRIKDLNRLINGDDDTYYRVSIDSNQVAQNFLLYEMSLPFGRDTSNFISLNKESLKVTARLRNQSSQQMISFEGSVNHWLNKNKPENVKIDYSSPAIIFSHIGASSIVSLLQGAFFALMVISCVMIFIFRSFFIGLASLLPNILPIGAAFGVWYLLSGQISMGLAGIAAMAIGIVVDDTVHFLYQYMQGLKRGLSPIESVRQTFDKTMAAIIISSVLLAIGFILLATSSFEKNADMGILTSVTILLALVFDLLLLPAIAMLFIKNKKSDKTQVLGEET